jgi:hypothetical protein
MGEYSSGKHLMEHENRWDVLIRRGQKANLKPSPRERGKGGKGWIRLIPSRNLVRRKKRKVNARFLYGTTVCRSTTTGRNGKSIWPNCRRRYREDFDPGRGQPDPGKIFMARKNGRRVLAILQAAIGGKPYRPGRSALSGRAVTPKKCLPPR